ncbi:uncharacterized protein TNCV_1098371 [Trichonephila clavipes]|nr:uncharacterized protein TNCV_1098371 [Trichonephila clavipes]
MDHDENPERCKLILTGMDDDALRFESELENCPVLRNSEKRTEVVFPNPPPNRRHAKERARIGKGGAGTLRDWKGFAIETLLMSAQINTEFVNHPVPSTAEPSTSLVRVGTYACESIINSILRYKDYDFQKKA